ncbi:MAG TPA: DUF997 family protein [Gemmataceae bacterium]|nr:DUF997 family protein [Gemmataceae bacterium]
MADPHIEPAKEQRLLRNARRESLVILSLFAACLIWSVTSAYVLGYGLPAAELSLILGMPSWVFWSVVLPWGLCLVFSVWFCFGFMADDDLGKDPEEGEEHA